MTSKAELTLDGLLEFVNQARGFDLSGYKRSSIQRRVTKRMSEVGVDSYEEYLDYLQLHAEEYVELFNTLLINVTSFFRDAQTWEYLASSVVPQLVDDELLRLSPRYDGQPAQAHAAQRRPDHAQLDVLQLSGAAGRRLHAGH